MPTKTAIENRKSRATDGGNGQGRVRSSERTSGEREMLRVSQEIMRLVDASRDGRLSERGKADQF